MPRARVADERAARSTMMLLAVRRRLAPRRTVPRKTRVAAGARLRRAEGLPRRRGVRCGIDGANLAQGLEVRPHAVVRQHRRADDDITQNGVLPVDTCCAMRAAPSI